MEHRLIYRLTSDEPAANLRQLLYGSDTHQKLPSPSSSTADGPNIQNVNFFTHFDKAFDLDFNSSQHPSDIALVKKQDEYIEQLEYENKILQEEMDVINRKVPEILNENQQLIQEMKSEAFSKLLPDTINTVIPKGLSDEEKMFRGHRDAEYINKVKQLEVDISQLREERKTIPKEDLVHNINILQRENQSLSLKIDQLEDAIERLKGREEEAQNKIKQGIMMVEQAQMEKFQAVVERDAVRENFDKQQKRFEEVIKDYERKIEAEKEKRFQFRDDQINDVERELQKANSTIAILKSSLEKNEREKIELRQQFQRVSLQLDNFQAERGMSAEKFQEEVTKALMERNYALENLAQAKMANERMKIEHQKEVQWMKNELDESRKKMDESDRAHLNAKAELSRVQHQKKVLERQFDYLKTMTTRQKNTTKEDAEEVTKYSKLREEQLQMAVESAKKHYAAKMSELEKMLEKQMEIGKRFRAECHLLEDKLQKLVEIHNHSSIDFRRRNENMLEKIAESERRCLQLEEKAEKSQSSHVDVERKQKEMEKEIMTKNSIIAEMDNQHKMLVKERELLKNELKFVLEHLNQGNNTIS